MDNPALTQQSHLCGTEEAVGVLRGSELKYLAMVGSLAIFNLLASGRLGDALLCTTNNFIPS